MLSVLVKVFRFDSVAALCGFAGKRHIPVVALGIGRASPTLTSI